MRDTILVGRTISEKSSTHIFTGANQWQAYMKLLKGKNVGIVANQTSVVNDTLDAQKLFAGGRFSFGRFYLCV